MDGELKPTGTPRDTFKTVEQTIDLPDAGFVVGIPTLNRFDLLPRSIDAILAGSVVPAAIYIVDNSGGKWEGHSSPLVKTIVPQYNLGCSRSWNLLMQLTQPFPMVVSSDDLEVGHNTLERMLACDADLVAASAGAAMMAFLIRHPAWVKVGKFDESIYPIYHEDNDYVRRAYLAGVSMGCPPSDGFRDHGPSATKRSLNGTEVYEWNHSFNLCRAYYLRKWGGVPHHELYAMPFDKDPVEEFLAVKHMDIENTNAIARWKKIQLGIPLT